METNNYDSRGDIELMKWQLPYSHIDLNLEVNPLNIQHTSSLASHRLSRIFLSTKRSEESRLFPPGYVI